MAHSRSRVQRGLVSFIVGEDHGAPEDRGSANGTVQTVGRCICEHASRCHNRVCTVHGCTHADQWSSPSRNTRNERMVHLVRRIVLRVWGFLRPAVCRHLYEGVPDAGRLVRLPPGYRFPLAGDYVDVRYDERLSTCDCFLRCDCQCRKRRRNRGSNALSDPFGTFRRIQDLLRQERCRSMAIAYRPVDGEDYIVLWPRDSTRFNIA